MTVTACALVIVAGLVLLKGVYDWSGKPDQVAAQPLPHNRVIMYSAAAAMIVGAALFAIAGARTTALAVAVTAVLPMLLILPTSHRLSDTLVPCLVTVTVAAAALAVRAVQVPQARVSPLVVAAFAVVIVAGSHMLAGLLDAVVSFDSSDETKRRESAGRSAAFLWGAVLLVAPLLLMLDGRRWAAATAAAFALVPLLAFRQVALLAGAAYLLAGPLAIAATIQAMFTSRP